MKLTMISDIKPYSAYKDSGDEWLGDVPTHWEVRRLRTLIRIINGATPASGEPRYWDGQITWITPEDLGKLSGVYVGESGRQITNEGYDACGTTLAPSGSLALSIRAPIGHLGLLTSSACVNQGCRLLVPGDAVRSSFLYHALRTARGELASLGQGTTFPELPASKLADLRITLPPLPEQAAIVRFLDHADRRIQRYIRAKQKLIALLEEQRKAATQEVIQSRSVTSNKIEVVADLVERPIQDEKDERGHRQVVRNGSHKPRELITGVGHLEIRQPRVHDRREDKTFSSAILPRYMRRAPSIDAPCGHRHLHPDWSLQSRTWHL